MGKNGPFVGEYFHFVGHYFPAKWKYSLLQGKKLKTAIPRTICLWENIVTMWDTNFHLNENILPQKGKKLTTEIRFLPLNVSFRSRDIFCVRENIILFERKIFYICQNENADLMMWNWEFRLCLVLLVHWTLWVYIHINDGEAICIPFTTARRCNHR